MDSTQTTLLPSQQDAIANIAAQAIALKPDATENILHMLQMSNISEAVLDDALLSIRQHARIALHFHPDRPVGDHVVARCLLEDGIYKSQFETGISNGSVSAHPGGARDDWERHLFGGAYHGSEGWSGPHRPKYGALDLMAHLDGPAPRFGSCFFVLKPHTLGRSTFTFGGSQDDPKYRGTIHEFNALLSALMEQSFIWESALGRDTMRPPLLLEHIRDLKTHRSQGQCRVGFMSHNLDHIIEAQVHGEVRLDRDVAELVADPSFRGGETGQVLQELSQRYKFPLRYHDGFQIRVADVPSDFRGPTMPSLGARVARDGIVNADAIGRAAWDLWRDPDAWADRGTYAQVVQEMKWMWHVLVRYGQPGPVTEEQGSREPSGAATQNQ